MSDPNTRSAEGEPWWPEFVSEFGKTPLRELARRFETNPRRLRRAAQRSGLTEDPENIDTVVDRLGTCADITLADELGVTAEIIAGARRRREVAAFDPTKAPPRPPKPAAPKPAAPKPDATSDEPVVTRAEPALDEQPAQAPAPRERPSRERPSRDRAKFDRKARYRPDPDAVVVVRRRSTPEAAPGPLPSQGLANLTRALPPRGEPSAPEAPAPAHGERPRRRRRIVSKPSDRDDSSEPEPSAAAPLPKQRRPRKQPPGGASAVRIVDADAITEIVDELVEDLMVDMVEAEMARPKVFKLPAPEPRPARIAPAAAPAPAPASGTLWIATVQTDGAARDIVIRAETVVDAARIASGHGDIAKLDRADLI